MNKISLVPPQAPKRKMKNFAGCICFTYFRKCFLFLFTKEADVPFYWYKYILCSYINRRKKIIKRHHKYFFLGIISLYSVLFFFLLAFYSLNAKSFILYNFNSFPRISSKMTLFSCVIYFNPLI